jgi:hypothetical protein
LNFETSAEGQETPFIEFRHYDIDIEKYSIKKTISNIINNKKTNLSNFDNIADYILKQSGFTSGSDNEGDLGVCEMIKDEQIKTEKEDEDKIKIKLNNLLAVFIPYYRLHFKS